MRPEWIVFAIATLASFAVLMACLRPSTGRHSMLLRLRAIERMEGRGKAQHAAEDDDSRRDYGALLDDFLRRHGLSRWLAELLMQAASTMSPGRATLIAAACAAGCALAAALWFRSLLLAVAGFVLGAAVPYGLLRMKRSRRLKAFDAVLPDAIELMARALRAGHSISSSIELIAEQFVDPLAAEFLQIHQQQKFGIRLRDALLQMGERVPSRDLHFLTTAILVQRETGGDLTEILDRTAEVIRERVRIEGEVRTRSAQGRLTGWILGSLPVVMLALISLISPSYSDILFHDPTGRKLLYASGILIAIGSLIIRKVVDVQV